MKINWSALEERAFALSLGLVLVSLGIGIALTVARRSETSDGFLSAHHCRLVSRGAEQSVPVWTPGPGGVLTFTTQIVPGPNGYECDNGYYSK